MVDWVWISKDEAVEVHGRQLAVHGGPAGIRDEGLFESALARAENVFAYGDPDIADLAAAYALRHRSKSSVHRRQQARLVRDVCDFPVIEWFRSAR